eukprot:TRINITY_DN32507_c0_g1_i1.p1 TRINITY_DN32507_c0_g1~~TRINITY_DN32507_c0_g1_i1.p1  ORF type:complete len:380 (+),score=71.18 TRINITY_DN32507_c0_g1_i1:61-1200(+)
MAFGGFGASSSAAGGGFGGFGASSSAGGGFGGFGAASSSGGFGAASSSGGFGGFGGGFGASKPGGFGGFGSSGGGFGGAGGGFGGGGFGPLAGNPQPQQQLDPYAELAGHGDHEPLAKFYRIYRQYYEKSPTCFCMAFLYNLVPESQVASLWEASKQKYHEERYNITEGQWAQAKRDNPDPSRLVPTPIRSLTELRARNDFQMKTIERYDQEKKQLTNQLQEMKRAYNFDEPGSLDRKVKDVLLRAARLRSRLLDAITKLERARPARSAMGRDQSALEDKLQRVEAKGNEFQQKLYELDVLLPTHRQGYHQPIANRQIPNETLRNLLLFLDHQQKALGSLGMLVNSCKEDLEIILGKAPPRVATGIASGSKTPPGFSNW